LVNESEKVFLGHRRLAIRDIDGGIQPMVAEGSRYAITYNGELYNDEELRSELRSVGHVFSTQSDTEVVLKSLIQWGQDALRRFDGMFALCFVDFMEKEAILARDRFGEKPLYYCQQGETIVFSSESSAIAEHPYINPELDELNCARFLLTGYLPPPHSIIRSVFQLRPGCHLKVRFRSAITCSEHEYAKPWDSWQGSVDVSADSLEVEAINCAVNSRLVSDVPVGILLSGGVDSSLIAYSAKLLNHDPETYTVGFEQESYDESKDASHFAGTLGLRNTQLRWSPQTSGELLGVIRTLDEPLGDSSYIPTYNVFQLASDRTKVLLTGDGADELFFGYAPFRVLRLARWVQKIVPRRMLGRVGDVLQLIPRSTSYMNRLDVATRFFNGLQFEKKLHLPVWMATLRTTKWKKYFNRKFEISDIFDQFVVQIPYLTDDDLLRKQFLLTYLPGSVLSKSDRASMAHSVESRTAIFHPLIVNFALKRTFSLEVRRGLQKQSLRKLLADEGFISVANRSKHGFAFPIAQALVGLKDSVPQLNLSCLNQNAFDEEWSRLGRKNRVDYSFLWSALVLANCRAFRVVSGRQRRSQQGH
jgi:asparagine synthase (glutamine-hydrolysing)